MTIRPASTQDRDQVQRVHWRAFPEVEREIVAKLAVDLLSENTTPPTLSLLAETDGVIVANAAFSPVDTDKKADFQGYILGPLGVIPDYQKRRVGSELVEYGVRRLLVMGVNLVLVYGDPRYYGRFGFSAEAAARFTPPYTLQYPFGWQALVLNPFDAGTTAVAVRCVRALRDPRLW